VDESLGLKSSEPEIPVAATPINDSTGESKKEPEMPVASVVSVLEGVVDTGVESREMSGLKNEEDEQRRLEEHEHQQQLQQRQEQQLQHQEEQNRQQEQQQQQELLQPNHQQQQQQQQQQQLHDIQRLEKPKQLSPQQPQHQQQSNLPFDESALRAREQQLLQLAQRNAALESELEALKTSTNSASTEQVRAEFTARLGQMESRLRSATTERDALRSQMESRIEAATKDIREQLVATTATCEKAKAAESAIREEGTALAGKVAKLEGLLKTVRAQLNEKTTALEKESRRAADAETKLAEVTLSLTTVKNDLQRWEGSAEGLKAVGARATAELSELRTGEVELKRKLAEAQQQLEVAWSDLASARQETASKVFMLPINELSRFA
jgi:chromosome segregation ATPase